MPAIGGASAVSFSSSCKEKKTIAECFLNSFFVHRFGFSPFEAATPEEVFAKILATTAVTFPDQPVVSADAKVEEKAKQKRCRKTETLFSRLLSAPSSRPPTVGSERMAALQRFETFELQSSVCSKCCCFVQVQRHVWFRGIVWGELQYSEPPFLPELDNQLDIGYFPSASKANLDQ